MSILAAVVAAALSGPVSGPSPIRHVRPDVVLMAACDELGQAYVVATNVSREPVVLSWTASAFHPEYGIDSWADVSTIAPGRAEAWLTPAPSLSVDMWHAGGEQFIEIECKGAE